MPNIDLSILNQKQTPAFYASSLATRPVFGFPGRIFIDTDSPSTGLYRDTGTAWVQIADPGAGTTGTLQQVTTNGNTTNQGITITAGGLTLGTSSGDNQTLLNLPGNTTLLYRENAGSLYGFNIGANDNSLFLNANEGAAYQTLYFGDGSTTNIFGISASDDSGVTYNSVFVVNQDKKVGVNTNAPTAAFDVHSDVSVIQQLNQTTATNNSLLAFQNSGTGKWRIGSFYNSGAEDFGIFDVVGAIQPVTVKKTTGQVLIGTSTVGSGKLVVASATSDNGIQIVGATAPSLRIDNAESGPTKRAGLGISTTTNNFIQGSADRDFCIFNGSTAAASPILFGIYDAGAVNVQEAARISSARNFLIGTTTDNSDKLQVTGNTYINGNVGIGNNQYNPQVRLRIRSGFSSYASDLATSASLATIQIATHSIDSTITTFSGLSGGNGIIQRSNGAGTSSYALLLNPFGGNIGINTTLTDNGVLTLIKNTSYNTENSYAISIQSNSLNAYTELQIGADDTVDCGVIQTAGKNTSFSSKKLALQPNGGNVLIGTTTDAGDKLQVNGAIKTASPSGGTAGSWKLGTATSGAAIQGGTVRIEINGVAYDLLTT